MEQKRKERMAPSCSQPSPELFAPFSTPAMNNSGTGIRWSTAERSIPLRRTASDIIRPSVHVDSTKNERINNAFAEGTLDVDEFKELKNPLVPQKMEIEQSLVALQTSRADRLEPLRNWILEANAAEKTVSDTNLLKMKSFLVRVGSNRLLHAQTLRVSFLKTLEFPR
jgi:hypothetical protein